MQKLEVVTTPKKYFINDIPFPHTQISVEHIVLFHHRAITIKQTMKFSNFVFKLLNKKIQDKIMWKTYHR